MGSLAIGVIRLVQPMRGTAAATGWQLRAQRHQVEVTPAPQPAAGREAV